MSTAEHALAPAAPLPPPQANMGSYLWGLAHRRCTVVAAAVWKETNVQLPFVFSRCVRS